VKRCNRGMSDGIEIFIANGRKPNEAHSAIIGLIVMDVMRAAIYRNGMSTLNQARAQFFSARLKAAIIGGDAACS